ncbi:hypothetical protein BKA93DRAFT_770292 [Sparassis latifolia]
MPEYVYALHDFVPEHEDEIAFKVGERIEVIEKDDEFGDGWWKGRNTSGADGLFPQSYTSQKPPSTSSIPSPERRSAPPSNDMLSQSMLGAPELQPLQEETDQDARVRKSPGQSDGEIMRKTMTDVQEAIEALGRQDNDSHSFDFGSLPGSDHESEEEGGSFTDPRDARQKLALRAQQANKERWAKENADSVPATPLRSVAPPIDVEMSDESEAEDEDEEHLELHHTPRPDDGSQSRMQSHISEDEAEHEETTDAGGPQPPPPVITIDDHSIPTSLPARQNSMGSSAHIVPSEDFIVPSPAIDEFDLPTATAAQVSFPVPSPVPSVATLPERRDEPDEFTAKGGLGMLQEVATTSSTPGPPDVESTTPVPQAFVPNAAMPVVSLPHPVAATPSLQTVTPTPSTFRTSQELPFTTLGMPSPSGSTFSTGIQQTLVTSRNVSGSPLQERAISGTPDASRIPSGHPSEWSVDEVVEWLKSKSFDQGVCDKFIEQEITGDVLLELDANVLKSEIGITAFGKRIRIVNAINELRRPPSLSESDHPAPLMTPRSQSQSLAYSHSHSASMQSSAQSWANSPLYTAPGFSPISSVTSTESPQYAGDLPGSPVKKNGFRVSDPASIHQVLPEQAQPLNEKAKDKAVAGLGLGFPSPPATVNGKEPKSRPAQLLLSPSDGALGIRAVNDDQASEAAEEEHTVMSDTEITRSKSKRLHLFSRSDSASIREKAHSFKDSIRSHSKEPVSPQSNGTSPGESKQESADTESLASTKRRPRAKKGDDDRKPSDRLSLFGSSFPATLGMARKPPPRLSGAVEKAAEVEKHLASTFSKMREKRASSRPSTADGSRKEKSLKESFPVIKETTESNEIKEKESSPTLLRKRTPSTVDGAPRPTTSVIQPGVPLLKAGQSILEQIGTPDHNGWMRKKGVRYNSWKLRYFVLKGPHLYWLRSNSKTETKIKGYVNIIGYRVVADENVDPGRYGFRIIHDTDKTYYFSSEEQMVIREWMKALMKATISRDYTNPVVSSCNVPTIPLTVAQAMNPAPRPPSPTARAATQKALRRENPNQLSSRDAQILLMGLPAKDKASNNERARLDSFFTNDTVSTTGTEPASPPRIAQLSKSAAPPRPSREIRRANSAQPETPLDADLMDWANSRLPDSLQISNPAGPLYGGLAILRLAESIKGKASSPPVPDSAFPSGPNDDKLDGLFRLFDFLLDNDVKMGAVSINDIRQGKREKVVQLLRALKTWDDKRRAVAQTVSGKTSPTLSSFAGSQGSPRLVY